MISPPGIAASANVMFFAVPNGSVFNGENTVGMPFTVTVEVAPVKSIVLEASPVLIVPVLPMLICANGRLSSTVSEIGPLTVIFLTA